jgi:hypothetical protein
LNRNPSIEEKELYEKILKDDSEESARIVYYLIMTSEEYNYY